MLALVNTPTGEQPVELREAPEPAATSDEALVEVRAFSLNRGDLYLPAGRPEDPRQRRCRRSGTRGGRGSGPPEGTRVVRLADEKGWAQRVVLPASQLYAPGAADGRTPPLKAHYSAPTRRKRSERTAD
jgi:NADPH:quinone reductase-like Zn-dependent oxidoreductase